MKKLNLNTIRIDGGTQSRVGLSESTVAEYVESLDSLPPVVVFFDGADHWLADGFHRLHAYRSAGKASVPADVRTGTQREAVLFSLGANAAHGLRRTNADKRKAVQTLLGDAEWTEWSDRKIAEACGVSNTFVSNLRKPPEVSTVDTQVPKKEAARVSTVDSQMPKKQAAEVSTVDTSEALPARDQQLDEAQHTISELAQENEILRDKLAVESLMDSEEAKTQTAETIRELRAMVKTLEAENAALKVSRDTYQREASEAKKSAIYWRKQAEKAAKDAA